MPDDDDLFWATDDEEETDFSLLAEFNPIEDRQAAEKEVDALVNALSADKPTSWISDALRSLEKRHYILSSTEGVLKKLLLASRKIILIPEHSSAVISVLRRVSNNESGDPSCLDAFSQLLSFIGTLKDQIIDSKALPTSNKSEFFNFAVHMLKNAVGLMRGHREIIGTWTKHLARFYIVDKRHAAFWDFASRADPRADIILAACHVVFIRRALPRRWPESVLRLWRRFNLAVARPVNWRFVVFLTEASIALIKHGDLSMSSEALQVFFNAATELAFVQQSLKNNSGDLKNSELIKILQMASMSTAFASAYLSSDPPLHLSRKPFLKFLTSIIRNAPQEALSTSADRIITQINKTLSALPLASCRRLAPSTAEVIAALLDSLPPGYRLKIAKALSSASMARLDFGLDVTVPLHAGVLFSLGRDVDRRLPRSVLTLPKVHLLQRSVSPTFENRTAALRVATAYLTTQETEVEAQNPELKDALRVVVESPRLLSSAVGLIDLKAFLEDHLAQSEQTGSGAFGYKMCTLLQNLDFAAECRDGAGLRGIVVRRLSRRRPVDAVDDFTISCLNILRALTVGFVGTELITVIDASNASKILQSQLRDSEAFRTGFYVHCQPQKILSPTLEPTILPKITEIGSKEVLRSLLTKIKPSKLLRHWLQPLPPRRLHSTPPPWFRPIIDYGIWLGRIQTTPEGLSQASKLCLKPQTVDWLTAAVFLTCECDYALTAAVLAHLEGTPVGQCFRSPSYVKSALWPVLEATGSSTWRFSQLLSFLWTAGMNFLPMDRIDELLLFAVWRPTDLRCLAEQLVTLQPATDSDVF